MPYRVSSSIYLTSKFEQLLIKVSLFKIINFFVINDDIIPFLKMIETFG